MKTSIAILIAAVAVTFLTLGMFRVQGEFTDFVQTRGGTDSVTPDLALYWHDITIEDLRLEDPEGFAALAELEPSSERSRQSNDWQIRTRDIIFVQRHGRPYLGRRDQ